MAASGLPSRAIAARLVVAVRTVDNALGQVYAKLRIGGRDELAPDLHGAGCAAPLEQILPCAPRALTSPDRVTKPPAPGRPAR